MKKIIYIFIMLFVAFATVQCSKKESLSSVNGNANGYMELRGDKVYISLPVGRSEQTKTVINGEDFTTTWQAGDKLYVVAPTGGCLGYLTAGADGASATFTGTISSWTGTQDLQFYYLGSGELATTATSFAYSVASQNGVLDDLAANLQLTHGEITGLVPSSRTLGSITMTNLIAVAKFDLIGKSGFASGTNVTCATVASATLNLTDGTFSDLTNGTITMSNPTAAYYAAFIPGSQNFTFSQSGCIDVVFNSSAALVGNDFITNNALAAIEVKNGGLGGYVEDGWGYGPGIEINGVVWAPVNCGIGYKYAYPYGKLYQWGRYSGQAYWVTGSTFIRYNGTTASAPDDLTFYYKNGDPAPTRWYTGTPYMKDWPISGSDNGYIEKKIDNPCPDGWRVPTSDELKSLLNNTTSTTQTSDWITDSETSIAGRRFYGNTSKTGNYIFLPAAGRNLGSTGIGEKQSSSGYYWATTANNKDGNYYAYDLVFTSSSSQLTTNSHIQGNSVRCVQDSTGIRGILNGQEYVIIKGSDGKYLKWATQNLAVTESGKAKWKSTNYQIGDYFQWAAYDGYVTGTKPENLVIYTSFDVSSGSFSGWKDGKNFANVHAPYRTLTSFSKYTSGSATLDKTDDVANIVLGGTWRMPTGGSTGELKAMYDVTKWTWDATDKGYYVTKKGVTLATDKSNALLFFPASGNSGGSALFEAGTGGHYWSCTLFSIDNPYSMNFSSSNVNPADNEKYRFNGLSVRPVSD